MEWCLPDRPLLRHRTLNILIPYILVLMGRELKEKFHYIKYGFSLLFLLLMVNDARISY